MSGDRLNNVRDECLGTYRRGCRCADCRTKHAERCRDQQTARRKKLADGLAKFNHGSSGYTNWSCRCDVCTAAWVEKLAQQRSSRKERPADIPMHGESGYTSWGCRCDVCSRAGVAAASQRHKRANDDSLERASNWGKQWTGPELELASRDDMNIKEIARLLARSEYAVANMRKKLKVDPRKVNLAGVPRQAHDRG